MKKLIIFLFLLLLPSIFAGVALYRYYPADSKRLIEMLKVKIVTLYPPLEMYIHIQKPPIKKPIPVENSPKRITIPKIPIFINSEIYEAICGEAPKMRLSDNFTGCGFCPKYITKVTNDKAFTFLFSYRGSFLKKGEEEALIFMKGCSREDENGTAIIVRNGYGGWNRQQIFQNILFDSPPLEYKDENGLITYVGKRTKTTSIDIHSELISLRFSKNGIAEKILFSANLDTGERCNELLQIAFEEPIKKNATQFQAQIEILSCKKGFLSGAYKLSFNLEENGFRANAETAKLMTRIEKYGELR
ncbi:hypothetical protein [Fluviispira sanaruensis]|uniref:Uncharacterized protein n=1 Tax=Fluviispira sanaruensis TaxID=2493639 RepID=A0A4V0P2D4_FLUSA|nr:hypothetical protein [Fluviispira sanaruensis]BBH52837.1 hypothetical protein JCM31447_321300 [Fluviispira sanaruensis]